MGASNQHFLRGGEKTRESAPRRLSGISLNWRSTVKLFGKFCFSAKQPKLEKSLPYTKEFIFIRAVIVIVRNTGSGCLSNLTFNGSLTNGKGRHKCLARNKI